MRELRKEGRVPPETTIGTEATGAYHLPLASTLTQAGWHVSVINPMLTSRLAKSRVRQVKTDEKDAELVRRSVASGDGYPFLDTPQILALKALVRQREGLVRVRSFLKQRLEAEAWCIQAAGTKIHPGFQRLLKPVIGEIKAVEKELARFEPETQALLRSIPGIGITCAAALVAGIGDIRRFPGPEQFVAYLGLDCRVHESGSSVHGKGYLTKRGNAYLRHLLFIAALVGKRHMPELEAYYRKKLAEGRHHTSALCAAERKLIHLIFAVWTRGTPFERRSQAKTPGEKSPGVDKPA